MISSFIIYVTIDYLQFIDCELLVTIDSAQQCYIKFMFEYFLEYCMPGRQEMCFLLQLLHCYLLHKAVYDWLEMLSHRIARLNM